MTHGGHVKEVQAAFHSVAGSNTPALSASSCEAGTRMYMASAMEIKQGWQWDSTPNTPAQPAW